MIIFHMLIVIRASDLGCGGRSRIFLVGASVARASAARVSMMRLTQRSCTAVRTEWFESLETADTKVKTTAVMLTVIWNCRNFLTASLTARPHMRAVIVEEKLSSSRIIDEASFATSVPAI